MPIIVGIIATVLIGARVHGAVLVWANAASGSASNPGSWAPPQFPNASDVLVFNVNGTYTVTFDGGAGFSQQQVYSGGQVTLNITSPHVTSTALFVGSNTSTPLMTLTTGQLTVPAMLVADGTGSSAGTLRINDDDALLNCPSTLVVGEDGSGTLELSGGGHAIATVFHAGRLATASGDVTVQSTNPTEVSELDATSIAVVGDAGDGNVQILDRGRMDVGTNLLIANAATSNSSLTLDSSVVPAAELNVGGDLHIGHSATGAAAGEGNVFVRGNAVVDVAGTTFIGNSGGGAAGFDELRVEDDSHFITGSLTGIAPFLHSFSGGTVTIDGGTLQFPSTQSLAVSGSSGPALMELINGAQGILSVPSAGALLLGVVGGGEGDFAVRSNSTCTISQGLVRINHGSLTVESGCTFDLAGSLIAEGDPAQITVNGTLEAGQVLIANGNSMTVTGAGAHATFSSQAHVGGTPAAPDTGGQLTIASGGTIQGANSGVIIYEGGELSLGAGTTCTLGDGPGFGVQEPIDLRGAIDLQGGTINCGMVIVQDNSQITGNGTINARIDMAGVTDGGAVISAVCCGPLTLGTSIMTSGFDGTGGTLNVGAQVVTLNDADAALLGNTTLTGGTLVLPSTPPAGGILISGRTLSGSGTITGGGLRNNGLVNSTGSGLNFGNVVVGQTPSTPITMTGTTIRFLSGGELIGQGSIAANLDGDAGSVITATGPLTMGNPASASGVILDGELHVSAHAVTLNDSNGVGLGSQTTMGGGTLAVSAGNLIVGPTDSLVGHGAVQGGLINLGHVETQTQVGSFTVTGNYTHIGAGGPGDLTININNTFGPMSVGGSATLAGELTLVSPVPSELELGQQYHIITAQSTSGTFSSVVLMGFPPCLDVQLVYGSTSVVVNIIAASCPADVAGAPTGGDGQVNIDDLLAVINGWGPCPGCAGDVAPLCGNGFINIDDLLAVINGWGACP